MTNLFVRNSWQFVDFFFVLSGFVIAANYRCRLADGMSSWRFVGLRFGRVYPLHVFVLVLFVVMELVGSIVSANGALRLMFDAEHSPDAIGLHLLMLQSFGLTKSLTWNGPAWSIATEFWAYVLFALSLAWFRSRLDMALCFTVLACPAILYLVESKGINVTYDWGMIRCIYGFALGILCWSAWPWVQAASTRLILPWTFIEALTLAVLCSFVVVAGASPISLFGPPLFAIAVLIFACEGGAVSRTLATPPLLFLGTISYSVYMLHSFVQARFDDVLKAIELLTGAPLTTMAVKVSGVPMTLAGATALQGTVFTILMLALLIAASYLTYTMIELPGQRLSRTFFGSRAQTRINETMPPRNH